MDKCTIITDEDENTKTEILKKIGLIQDEFLSKCCKKNLADNYELLQNPNTVYCQQIIMEILELLRKTAPTYYAEANKINNNQLPINSKVRAMYGIIIAFRKSITRGDFDINEVQAINKLNLTKKEWMIESQKNEDIINKYNHIFDKLDIHQKIKEVSKSFFKDGYYSSAIEAAFKQIILMVKEKANHPKGNNGQELDGQKLMFTVFSKELPVLKLNDLKTDIDKDEQDGFRYLFGGASQGIRNPKAHSIQDLKDPQKAIEYILFASLLARKIDEAKLKDN